MNLVPKSKLKGTIEENLLNIFNLTKYQYFDNIDQVKWQEFINSYDGQIEVHHTALFDNGINAPWIWCYRNDSYIELTIKNCRKSEILITETKIESPSICGIWWSQITNISIKENKNDVIISFLTKSNKIVPTLIGYCSESDLLSIFYLGIFCLLLSNIEYYLSFMTKAAEKGQFDAQMHLWKYFYNVNQIEKSLHWLSTVTLKFNDLQSSLCLSQILSDTSSPINNYSLSEHLLIKIINKHEKNSSFEIKVNNTNDEIYIDAMLALGKIYLLNDVEDAPHDSELGLKLLEKSSNMLNIPEIQQPINDCVLENKISSISTIDIAISTGIVVAAIAVVGFFISKRRH